MITTNHCLHTTHVLCAPTDTLYVMYVKSIITWDHYKRKCVRRQVTYKITVKHFGKQFFVWWKLKLYFSWMLYILSSIWAFATFAKTLFISFAVSYFTEVFSLQNFVLYGIGFFLSYVLTVKPGNIRNWLSKHGDLIKKQQVCVQWYSSCSGTVKY